MTIISNPPDAMVYIDNYEIGKTPVSTDFTYYGTRNIRLEKDGYETLNVSAPVRAPWYQWPGIDFFADNVVPCEINDHRRLNFNLDRIKNENNDDLEARGNALKEENQASYNYFNVDNGALPPGISSAPAYNNPQNGYNTSEPSDGPSNFGWGGSSSSWAGNPPPPSYSSPERSNSIADQPGVLPAGEPGETN